MSRARETCLAGCEPLCLPSSTQFTAVRDSHALGLLAELGLLNQECDLLSLSEEAHDTWTAFGTTGVRVASCQHDAEAVWSWIAFFCLCASALAAYAGFHAWRRLLPQSRF